MTKAKPLPTIELINELLDYDPFTGEFRWKVDGKRLRIGSIAGGTNSQGYVRITIQGQIFAAHRLAWFMINKVDPTHLFIDHINGNKADNCIANLRLATASQNCCNRRKKELKRESFFKGVFISRGKWKAVIMLHGRKSHLGTFDSPELAHMAYCKAAAELHGDFARGA